MRTILLLSGLLVAAVVIAGCGTSASTQTSLKADVSAEPSPPWKIISQIDEAGTLTDETQKRDTYKAIAESRGLSGDIQLHLVKAVFDNLTSSSAKQEVLLALTWNPDFNCSAKMAILDRLKELESKNRRDILEAFHKRQACKTK